MLRKAKGTDFDALYPVRQSEYVLKYNCMNRLTEQEMKQMIQADAETDFVWYLELLETHQAIGAVYLHSDSIRYHTHTMELSYWLSEEYCSRGLMYEALEVILSFAWNQLELTGITARCFEDNIASRKLLEKLGFAQEGILKKAVKGYRDVVYNDVIYFIEH